MQAEYAVVVGGNSMERMGLSAILRQEGLGYSVAEIESPEDLPNILMQRRPSLLVVDAEMEDWDFPASVRSICAANPDIKVCVSVANLTREIAAQCIAAGAMGCIEKSQSVDEVRQAFETISEGGIYLHNPSHAPEMGESQPAGLPASGDGTALTPRQRSVLDVMAQGKSNKEIARVLGIREGTVKVHLVAAYRSLGVRNRVAALHAINSEPHMPNALNAAGSRVPAQDIGPGMGASMASSLAGRTAPERRLAS